MSQTAIFAAGCFWGVEARFSELSGVIETEVGYMGGTVREPTYEEVCSDTTGHAEVVKVTFDPMKISYEQLLVRFWEIHDPTTPDRQGSDTGSQYRSAIFFQGESQRIEAEQSKSAIEHSKVFPEPIVTRIEPANTFWRAEEYHQQYLAKREL